MADLTIKYKKKRLYINLFMALFWIALAVLALWENYSINWYNFGFLLAATLYLTQFIWDISYQYVTITDKFIRKNGLLIKKILLKDITHVEKTGNGYTLKTTGKTLVIKAHLIDENSLVELESFLDAVNPSEEKYYKLKL
ncbi:hypothetical protein BZARG_2018 [Bizionia argentinensis JUB59]|uniref:Uncharacterized protein n=1 Tax=Bizionia argentinensis JUB59 TaxID=1046627 RepID=G2EF84_9FLAO|nr:hypothetical protein [Bizionia argentinensis]EGV42901.2 hypothetical protein BZARG_2018 [Bizionia argentinensis JUB59]